MSTRFYNTDLTDAAWAFVAPVLPAARPGGRPLSVEDFRLYKAMQKWYLDIGDMLAYLND